MDLFVHNFYHWFPAETVACAELTRSPKKSLATQAAGLLSSDDGDAAFKSPF
jgi:hypothetical protein